MTDTIAIADHQVRLEGVVYDLREFSKVHPGGSNSLVIFGGKDATTHYYMLHPHHRIRTHILDKYKVSSVAAVAAVATIASDVSKENALFNELKASVAKAVPYPYATNEWWMKAIAIMIAEIYVEYHNYIYGYTIIKSILLGFLMAMIGLCIQHDANHGAVSRRETINRLWGYTQDWIGGSSLLWKHHHVLLHHAYTNVIEHDPDITTDILRLHKDIRYKAHHSWQKIYIWFLFLFLPLNWHFAEFRDLWKMNHMSHRISSFAANEQKIAIILRIAFYIRFYTLPLYRYPSFDTLLHIGISLAVGGIYLGLNFIISHNFEGVKNNNATTATADNWAISQVESSSTVGGRVLGFFHGGLNYQIEHHLFPRISHVHYYKIKPIVQDWCKKNNIKYTYYNTLWENIQSCYKYLELRGCGGSGSGD
jgi:acyl-lipid (7-3)-desaturase (Delta-4 desaturase)